MRSALLIVPLMLLACGNEEEIKKKVAVVQQQADEQVSKAKQAAQQKLDELQKQFEELKENGTLSYEMLSYLNLISCKSKTERRQESSNGIK